MDGQQFKTEQEHFWAGEFGREYITRNTSERYLASNTAMFSRILSRTDRVDSLIELGANIGLNLEALQSLLPKAEMAAVEINETACQQLQQRLPAVAVEQCSILEMEARRTFDLALIKTVLIHVNPDELPGVYDMLAKLSSRYVVIAEYYNPAPVTVEYRGHSQRLFKRDFAGEFLDRHPQFEPVDYGFVWHRDPQFPQDDMTWFLLRRRDQ